MHILNDSSYFTRDFVPTIKPLRCKNVISRSFLNPTFPHTYASNKIVSIFKARNIDVGYDMKYND